MKREIGVEGKVVYKFSHSVHQGGYAYGHKTKENHIIKDREGLRDALNAIARQYGLMDVTIKVYSNIFFIFFMMRPSIAPQKIIDAIQKGIGEFSEWSDDYIFSGMHDLQEKFIKEELAKWGLDYEQG